MLPRRVVYSKQIYCALCVKFQYSVCSYSKALVINSVLVTVAAVVHPDRIQCAVILLIYLGIRASS